ncbi:MAG: hypothetical protein Greene041619_322 [Candidatus Peregrinibacteria bacterium Greene0416_19]|nr:MAG: hypothetical protein Greene041619_322 [Candidatus Peregrinibacteria bacterium Greene0416_19]
MENVCLCVGRSADITLSMRIVNVLSIGAFFAILPFPVLLQTEAAECTQPEYTCLRTCALPTLDQTIACSTSCNAQYQAAMAQYDQCVQGPSESKLPPPSPPPPSSFSSSSSSKSTHTTPTPKTKIYKFGDLKEGDRVTTGKGELATIYVDSRGSRAELEPNSAFIVVKPDEYKTLKGKFAFYFEKLSQGMNTRFRVFTGTAVCAVRGTKFLTSVTKTKTVVQVLDGLVSVSNLKGTKSVEVSAGYQTTVTKTKLHIPKPFTERQRIIPQ